MRCARGLSIIAVVLAGGALLGCASDGDGDGASVDKPQIRAVVEGYTSAVAAGDGAKACSYLGEVMRATFERKGLVLKLGGCAGYMDRLIAHGRQARGGKPLQVEVTSIWISKGATWAIARMKAPDGSTSTESLHWEHPGGWKIAPDLQGAPPSDPVAPPPSTAPPTV